MHRNMRHSLEWRSGALWCNEVEIIPESDTVWRTKLKCLHPTGAWSQKFNWGKDNVINVRCTLG